MTKHSFKTTSPVKEQQNPLTQKELKPLIELLTKTDNEPIIEKTAEPETNLAKALIQGLETNNYDLFGELLLESKRNDEEKLHNNKTAKEVITEFTNALTFFTLKLSAHSPKTLLSITFSSTKGTILAQPFP